MATRLFEIRLIISCSILGVPQPNCIGAMQWQSSRRTFASSPAAHG